MMTTTHVNCWRSFSADVGEVSQARRFANEALKSWHVDPTIVTMVVGELATNAVVHGRTAFVVTLSDDDGRIRVEVIDQNPRLPAPAFQSPDARSGRGLHIVECLSTRWGTDLIPGEGKAVWAEIEAVELD
jgi:anti-sigma regulatory factor (Ser/Thr protein kinase)